MTWDVAVTGDRLDWHEVRDRVDVAAVATNQMGPAPGRRGEHGRRLWWSCPFHEDANPSFCIEPGKPWWRCYGCGEHGDAANLVMKLQGVGFREAIEIVAELAGIVAPSGRSTGTFPRPEVPSGLPPADALSLVTEAALRLWTPEGIEALAYLYGRGLTDKTIRAAYLGWTPGVMIPTREGNRRFQAPGVVIPWFDGDRLTHVKIRQPEGAKPKYAEAYRDRPAVYRALGVIQPGHPLIIVEGDFDALLVGQELGDLAAVVTLGSASSRPDPSLLGRMLAAAPWYVATDADQAGDKAALGWPAGTIRVRPPEGVKDWTELWQAGFNSIRYHWGRYLPISRTWDELAALRWGPALDDSCEVTKTN
jgi:DNA primase